MTGLYPWLGYEATDRVTVWGVAGYGRGGLLLTPESGTALESGLSMAMAAAGTRGELIADGDGGFALAFKADALWVGTAIDGVDGRAGCLKATRGGDPLPDGPGRLTAYKFAGRLSLRPSVEVGLWHDGGDAETGAGMDVGAGLIVSDSSTGLALDVRVRTLLVHQAEGVPRAGHGAVSELQPDAVEGGLHGEGCAVVGAARLRAGPRRCGAGRRCRGWGTAASRRATASTARSATGCRWAADSSGRRGSASARRSTAGTTGSATASGCSSKGT